MTEEESWPEAKCLRVARQFFELHDGRSPRELSELLGGQISEATVRRDREECRKASGASAPSVRSARTYAAALGFPDGMDLDAPGMLRRFVDTAIALRRQFHARFPLLTYRTGSLIRLPRNFDRILRRIEEKNWTSVIDLIEPVLEEEPVPEDCRGAEPYLAFYLGLAFKREGDEAQGLRWFRRAFALVSGSNVETDLRRDAALEVAAGLVRLGRDFDDPAELRRAFEDALLFGAGDPVTLSNLLVLVTRLDEVNGAYWGRALVERLRRAGPDFDWPLFRATITTDVELKSCQDHAIYREVLHLADDRPDGGSP